MAGYDGRGARFNIVAVEGNDLSFTVTAVDDADAAINLSAATITASIYNGAGTVVDTLTDAVSGAGSNVITLSLTDAEVDALTEPKSWALVVERGGDARTWLAGSFTVSDAARGRTGTSGTAVTATVDTNVVVTADVLTSAGGVSTLDGLSDVTITTPISGNSLTYNGSGWVNSTPAGGGDLVAANNLSDVANAATARTNLGLAIGTNVQAYDADLATLATAGNSAVLAATTASFTTADETKLDGIESGATADQSAAEILAALLTVDGAGSGLDADLLDGNSSAAFQPIDSDLTAIAALTTTAYGRAFLALADQSALVALLPSYQPLDSDLTAIAALTTTAFGRGLLALADAAALRSSAGLDADLGTFSVPASTTISAFGATLVDDADQSTARTTLGLGTMATATATDYQTKATFPGSISVALSDMTTQITTGATKAYWVNPFDTTLTVTKVKATLATAGSGSTVVDINEGAGAGTSILSTKITIDASGTDSDTAGTPPVISDTSIAADGRLTFDIDTAGTSAAGLIVTILFTRTV